MEAQTGETKVMKPVFRITFILLILTVILSIIGISSQTAWNLDGENFVNIISVILQIQATMFAIIFGFSIISIERTSEFYSSEIIYANIQKSKLVWVVGTYLLSIAVSTFSMLWGNQLRDLGFNLGIIIFCNIIFIPLGILTLIYYLRNVAKGITDEALLRQLSERANTRDLIQCIQSASPHAHNWIDANFPHYAPIRGIIDIIIEATNDNHLLSANGLKILLALTNKICNDKGTITKVVQELQILRKTQRDLLKIVEKTSSPALYWQLFWKIGKEIEPIHIHWYFSSLFFGLYDLMVDQDKNDLALLCIDGIKFSLQEKIFEMDRWWWSKIEEIFSHAATHNKLTQMQKISDLIYEEQSLPYFARTNSRTELQDFFKSTPLKLSYMPGRLERMIQMALDNSVYQPLTGMLKFSLLTAKLSVLQKDTMRGTTAEALQLFSGSIIEIGNIPWLGNEIIYACMQDFQPTAKFIVRQIYELGFAEDDPWCRGFTSTYVVQLCMVPLGNYLFSKEWINSLFFLTSTACYVTQKDFLGRAKISNSTLNDGYCNRQIVRMYEEWFKSCPRLSKEKEWRNNADLITDVICESANYIRHNNEEAFLAYYDELEKAFENTYIWREITKSLTPPKNLFS